MFGFERVAETGFPVYLDGTFRENIRQFLLHYADPMDYTIEGMPIRRTSLLYEREGKRVPLYTIEENLVPRKTIPEKVIKPHDRPFCGYCCSTGWSRHFVSKMTYHIIIPATDEWNNPLDEGTFEDETHLLHGLIHSNGYGHLVCINGIQGGSGFICGAQIMNLWDTICTSLHVRKISVEDVSRKHGMDLRLIYGLSHGASWFGRWGYRFCHGSFGVKEDDYWTAMDVLSSCKLDQVADETGERIIHLCRSMSHANLVTIRDLFRFILTLKSSKRPPCSATRYKQFSHLDVSRSVWSIKELQGVARIIVRALKQKREGNEASSGRMTRQEIHDHVNFILGDTERVEYVLKIMKNVIVGNNIVRRVVNRHSRIQEYTIQDLSTLDPEPGQSILDDIRYLCESVLFRSYSDYVQKILGCKHFVKEFPLRDEDDGSLRFVCRLTSSIDLFHDTPLGDLKIGVQNATIGDLKVAVQNAVGDTYCAMGEFRVSDILNVEGEDGDLLLGLVESGNMIWVECCGMDLESELWFQGWVASRMVDCKCGAKEDDGERMATCFKCKVRKHTCCSGVEDDGAWAFSCDSCRDINRYKT